VFVEEHPDRSEACKREYQIKQFSKAEKEALITSPG
jgi:putative endonuclease